MLGVQAVTVQVGTVTARRDRVQLLQDGTGYCWPPKALRRETDQKVPCMISAKQHCFMQKAAADCSKAAACVEESAACNWLRVCLANLVDVIHPMLKVIDPGMLLWVIPFAAPKAL